MSVDAVGDEIADASLGPSLAHALAAVGEGESARPMLARLLEQHRVAPDCASCHRPDLSGQQQVPRLAGQDYAYLLRLLSGFKAKTASDLDGTMTMAAQPLREEEIVALVHYMASLGTPP